MSTLQPYVKYLLLVMRKKSLTLKLLDPIKRKSQSHFTLVSIRMAGDLVCFVILNLLIIQHWRNRFYVAADQSTKMVNGTLTGNITFLLHT